jgi:hypothetical protein
MDGTEVADGGIEADGAVRTGVDAGADAGSGDRFEPAEIGGFAVLAAITVVAVASTVGGIVSGLAEITPTSQYGSYLVMLQATVWSGPVLTVVALGMVALGWWQADAWADAFADDGLDGTFRGRAYTHLARARTLALWGVVFAMVATAASVAAAVADVGTANPPGFSVGQVAAGRLVTGGGNVVANLVMTVAGVALFLVALRRVASCAPKPDDAGDADRAGQLAG